MTNGKKPKKRKLKNLSKTTKKVMKASKRVSKLIKKGKAGKADASGGSLLKSTNSEYASGITAKKTRSDNPYYGTGREGSGGNQAIPKKRKKKG